MNGDSERRGGLRSNRGVITMAMGVVIMIVIACALLSGPILDEYWTLALSDLSHGPKALAKEWLGFTRPPIFNIWTTLLSAAGFTSIPVARIITNLPALGFMLFASRRLLDRLPQQSRYHAVFMLLVLSAGPTMKAFATYRSDFWQMMAFTTQIMIVRHIFFVGEDFRRRRDAAVALLAIIATMAAILLDYIAGLCAAVLTIATILGCMANGLRKWARFLTMLLVATAIVVGAIANFQSEYWLVNFDRYQSWIQLEHAPTSSIMLMFIFGTIVHNPVALIGGWLERHGWDSRDTGFLMTIGGTVIMSLLLLVEIDAQKNIITTDNAADIALLICAMMAVLGARLFRRPKWVIGFAAYAVFSAILGFLLVGTHKNWQESAKIIRRTVAACPSATTYVTSGWVLQDKPESITAQREKPVFVLGYETLAQSQGFRLQWVGTKPVAAIAPGECPTLLWIEQVPPWRRLKPAEILQAAKLGGLDKSKLKLIRTDTGLILRADRN